MARPETLLQQAPGGSGDLLSAPRRGGWQNIEVYGMDQTERAELEKWIEIIWEKAHEMGLEPFPTHFEVVPDHVIYELGAYGLPARFSHWTFGRDYHRQKTSYEYGMSKIYEIVFNTDPTQAFLFDNNSMVSHKLVIAHVYGHSDFFRRNTYFSHTDRRMIEQVRLHALRIAEYETQHGPEEVERFLDAALSIEEHFDPTAVSYRPRTPDEYERERQSQTEPATEYDDLWRLGQNEPAKPPASRPRKLPPEPEKDLLRFLRDHALELEDWQRDILNILREEMLYFLPQMRTKIMNEGWASFWHERILTELPLTPEEHWEFRRLHSGVVSPGSRMSINPYYVGYQMFHDIERRWNGERDPEEPEEDWRGEEIVRPTGEGLRKIYEVAEQESDVSFLRKYLTKRLVRDLDLYTYRLEEINGELMWVVQDTDWRRVRDTMVDSMTNFGIPVIMVEDGDYKRRHELYLKHYYDGKPLDTDYTARTMKNIYRIWGRAVHLETVLNDEATLLTYDGERFSQTAL
jgi:stage V sporulation protein R